VGIVITLVGLAIILITMRDVIHELFHPEGTGSISRRVMKATWHVVRAVCRVRPGAMQRAGPLILVAVAFVWAVLMVTGWALVYLPRLPEGFLPEPGLPVHERHGIWTAYYLSLANITTLGASGLTAQIDGLRYASSIEALVGFVMFSAWITWVLSIYPVLAERRAFARQVGLLRAATPSPARFVREAPESAVEAVMLSMTRQVLHVGVRLSQSHVTYYFQGDSPDSTLAVQLPWLLALARAAEGADSPGLRHHARMMRMAVEETLSGLGTQFLGLPEDAPPRTVIQALARDHLIDVPELPE
jgi:hypothetical protein